MALRTLSAKAAAELDKELMSSGAFSIDQLMELAGLSVSQAIYCVHPPSAGRNILIACGPGNNGGDGLVAARHLSHYHYKPTLFYPKQPSNDLYQRLLTQCRDLNIPVITSASDFPTALESTDHVVDAIFGFSFSGGEVREPFGSVISALRERKKGLKVTAIDVPSGWGVDSGPSEDGGWLPDVLVSLTAPKPCVRWFKGGRHFVGGRFVSPGVKEKYGLELPEYEGTDQIAEVLVEE